MNGNVSPESVETVIIGAGQAGLATGYHLARQGRPFVILEADARVGDVWRKRYDSLRLYSPAGFAALPGMRFPAPRWSFATGREMGDYLEAYAKRFELPIRTGVRVDGLARVHDRYVVSWDDGLVEADNVVVASGTFDKPIVPEFAAALDPRITQLHSAQYRNPSQLQEGAVLVVGAAHSGADIALEVARKQRTILTGPDRGQLPFRPEHKRARVILPVFVFLAKHLFTERTPIGRKLRPKVRSHGGPMLRVKREDLLAAGVERVHAKVLGVVDGKPALADGRVVDVTNVIWCTGFSKDLSWIEIPVAGTDGWPDQVRGVVDSSPGLYFVGLPFLYALASMAIGGVGRDAEYVAKHIAKRAALGNRSSELVMDVA
jgi:putative flavoprotein involved in K+ transport